MEGVSVPKRPRTQILGQFGWDIEDLGAVEAARAIEPLCMLWCIPGVGKGDWSPQAFKLSRQGVLGA
jgi:8-hydroxy-5-deazaflavin:NADPH oxidoreductase